MDTAEDKTAVVDLTILGVLRDFRRGIYLGIDTQVIYLLSSQHKKGLN